MIEQRIEDECHVVEHALFASLVALSSVERVELDSQLGWGVRAEVIDLHLLRDQVAVVSALQFAGVELEDATNYHVFFDKSDLELFVEEVHERECAVNLVDRKCFAVWGSWL